MVDGTIIAKEIAYMTTGNGLDIESFDGNLELSMIRDCNYQLNAVRRISLSRE